MKDILCDEFQNTVGELLIRHKSILDILSKSQEASGRLNRAIAKAATDCGCIKVRTDKKTMPPDISINDFKNLSENHVEGDLCTSCRDIIETELGKSLFYTTALCNTLDLNLYDVLLKEHKKISTLRIFNIT